MVRCIEINRWALGATPLSFMGFSEKYVPWSSGLSEVTIIIMGVRADNFQEKHRSSKWKDKMQNLVSQWRSKVEFVIGPFFHQKTIELHFTLWGYDAR